MAMIKTRREIALLRKACEISNSCIPIIEKALREDGMTERELAARVRRNIYKKGGRLSFRTLVGSGERSAMIHTKPAVTDNVISGIGYIDFGASYGGYKADVTVPFVKGKVDAKDRRIVDSVQRAYKIAVSKWKIGLPCWKLHEAASDYMKSRGYSMGHALGHGVGLRIHEMPLIVKPRKEPKGKWLRKWEKVRKIEFQPGMAFTIEPGAYVKGRGGSRIENTFLADGKTLKCLTRANLIEVR